MAIITKFLKGGASAPTEQVGTYLMSAENILDFGAPGFNDVVAADEVYAISLPPHAVVKNITYQVFVDDLGGTLNIGDGNEGGDNSDGWVNGIVTLPGDLIAGDNTYPTAGNPIYYPDGGVVQLRPFASLTSLVIWIQCEYYIRELY